MDLIEAMIAFIFRILQCVIGTLVRIVPSAEDTFAPQPWSTAISFSVIGWNHFPTFSVRRYVVPDEIWEQDDGWSNIGPDCGRSWRNRRPILN